MHLELTFVRKYYKYLVSLLFFPFFMNIQHSQHHLLNTVSWNPQQMIVFHQPYTYISMYVWASNSVPLVFKSILMPTSYCFGYCSVIRNCDDSDLVVIASYLFFRQFVPNMHKQNWFVHFLYSAILLDSLFSFNRVFRTFYVLMMSYSETVLLHF